MKNLSAYAVWQKKSPSDYFEEIGLVEKINNPLERYMLDLIAIGKVYEDVPNPQPKDLGEDLTSKWKMEEMEYQARKARLLNA